MKPRKTSRRKAYNSKMNIKKRIVLSIIAALLVLIGAALFVYPTVSNCFANNSHAKAISHYDESIKSTGEANLEKEWKAAREYNDNLAGDPVHDPFVAGSGFALPDNYTSCLNLNGDGIMGYIEIPKISLKLPIYHGTSEDVLQKGVGHISETSLPIGGSRRHSVLTGHRGLPSAELFTRLDELEKGDCFYIYILNSVLAYKVIDIKTILPQDFQSISMNEESDLVTLVTCTPYAINTHRLLVTGERCKYTPPAKAENADNANVTDSINHSYQILGAVIGIGLIAIVIIIRAVLLRKKQRNLNRTDNNQTPPDF